MSHPINTSISTKNPAELQEHLDWLLNHDYEAVIKERKLPTGNITYSVWRNPRMNEANIPMEGYGKWTGRSFWRVDENPQKMTDSICPRCGVKHKDTQGRRTFCKKCKTASKRTEGYGCESGKQKKSRRRDV